MEKRAGSKYWSEFSSEKSCNFSGTRSGNMAADANPG